MPVWLITPSSLHLISFVFISILTNTQSPLHHDLSQPLPLLVRNQRQHAHRRVLDVVVFLQQRDVALHYRLGVVDLLLLLFLLRPIVVVAVIVVVE